MTLVSEEELCHLCADALLLYTCMSMQVVKAERAFDTGSACLNTRTLHACMLTLHANRLDILCEAFHYSSYMHCSSSQFNLWTILAGSCIDNMNMYMCEQFRQ